ncbi:MAG: hypothetical protein GF329_22710 [Candidatus Lokiarchaeota archaeon]|nr:hypothetical protein [Candidatus Lokiarchaeota archaeon]
MVYDGNNKEIEHLKPKIKDILNSNVIATLDDIKIKYDIESPKNLVNSIIESIVENTSDFNYNSMSGVFTNEKLLTDAIKIIKQNKNHYIQLEILNMAKIDAKDEHNKYIKSLSNALNKNLINAIIYILENSETNFHYSAKLLKHLLVKTMNEDLYFLFKKVSIMLVNRLLKSFQFFNLQLLMKDLVKIIEEILRFLDISGHKAGLADNLDFLSTFIEEFKDFRQPGIAPAINQIKNQLINRMNFGREVLKNLSYVSNSFNKIRPGFKVQTTFGVFKYIVHKIRLASDPPLLITPHGEWIPITAIRAVINDIVVLREPEVGEYGPTSLLPISIHEAKYGSTISILKSSIKQVFKLKDYDIRDLVEVKSLIDSWGIELGLHLGWYNTAERYDVIPDIIVYLRNNKLIYAWVMSSLHIAFRDIDRKNKLLMQEYESTWNYEYRPYPPEVYYYSKQGKRNKVGILRVNISRNLIMNQLESGLDDADIIEDAMEWLK